MATGGDALSSALCTQIEFYFSKENLARDPYLVSQMDAQLFVPISVIASFDKIKELTSDETLLASAVKQSNKVIVDEEGTKLKPNMQAMRDTIILREIPSDTPEEEVKAMFREINGSDPEKLRSDVGDTWFVTLKDEETAVRTMSNLMQRKFKGKPIKARLKSENILRTLVSTAASSEPRTAEPPKGTSSPHFGAFTGPAGGMGAPFFGNLGQSGFGQMGYAGGMNQFGAGYGKPKGGKAPASPGRAGGRQRTNAPGGNRRTTRGGAQARGGSREDSRRKAAQAPPPQLSSSNFPPLPTADEIGAMLMGGDMPAAGYQGDFKKYTTAELLHVIKTIPKTPGIKRPEAMSHKDHPAVVAAQMNSDLVGKQRTDSMEQALRHGRPRFDSDASISSVDYKIMMYGDDAHGRSRRGSHASNRRSSVASRPSFGGASDGVTAPKDVTEPKSAAQDTSAEAKPVAATSAAAPAKQDASVPAADAAAAPPAVAAQPPAAGRRRGWEKPGLPQVKPKVVTPPAPAPAEKAEKVQTGAKETSKAAAPKAAPAAGRGKKGGRGTRAKTNNKGAAAEGKKAPQGAQTATAAAAAAAAAAASTQVLSWGSKQSFASVLKKAGSDAAPAARAAAEPKPKRSEGGAAPAGGKAMETRQFLDDAELKEANDRRRQREEGRQRKN